MHPQHPVHLRWPRCSASGRAPSGPPGRRRRLLEARAARAEPARPGRPRPRPRTPGEATSRSGWPAATAAQPAAVRATGRVFSHHAPCRRSSLQAAATIRTGSSAGRLTSRTAVPSAVSRAARMSRTPASPSASPTARRDLGDDGVHVHGGMCPGAVGEVMIRQYGILAHHAGHGCSTKLRGAEAARGSAAGAAACPAIDARGRRPDSPVTDVAVLQGLATAAVDAGGGHVLDASHVVFPNGAITLVLILAESHLSIHTWPEENLIAIDLFSCGAIGEPSGAGRADRGAGAHRGHHPRGPARPAARVGGPAGSSLRFGHQELTPWVIDIPGSLGPGAQPRSRSMTLAIMRAYVAELVGRVALLVDDQVVVLGPLHGRLSGAGRDGLLAEPADGGEAAVGRARLGRDQPAEAGPADRAGGRRHGSHDDRVAQDVRAEGDDVAGGSRDLSTTSCVIEATWAEVRTETDVHAGSGGSLERRPGPEVTGAAELVPAPRPTREPRTRCSRAWRGRSAACGGRLAVASASPR